VVAKKPVSKSASKKRTRTSSSPESARPRKTAVDDGRATKAVSNRKRVAAERTQPPRKATVVRSPVDNGEGGRVRTSAEAGLNKRDLEQFREMLLRKRAELVGDVHTLRDEALKGSRQDAAGDLSSMPIHMADLGTDNYELEFTLGLIEGGRAVLQEIDEALERIERGTYGICLATGKAIGKARLRAKPWAKFSYEYVLAQETGKRA
jgi:DnaK suppressor protein